MSTMVSIELIRKALQTSEIDAWLLYDFRGSNSIAWDILGLPSGAHCTRRWAVILPASGEPLKIVHAIEAHTLRHVPAREIVYSSRNEWAQAVADAVGKYNRIAMEYSPNNELPVVSKADAGVIEWLRSLGVEIVSSADIAQQFSAVWSERQLAENLETAKRLRSAMMYGFSLISAGLAEHKQISEYGVQQGIVERFGELGLVADHPPIVAVNANAANPHYAPNAEQHSPIRPGDSILIDMWATQGGPESVFADITWMGFAGATVPDKVANLFSIIRDARDSVVDHLRTHLGRTPVRGCDLDDCARDVIEKAGYGQYFIHRTGHNITTQEHGPGANLDNYETRDTRTILPMTSFSIEPGIYIPGDIGLRTEIDVIVTQSYDIIIPSAPIQETPIALLSEPQLDLARTP